MSDPILPVRVDLIEREQWGAHAESRGMSVSELVRVSVRAFIAEPGDLARSLEREHLLKRRLAAHKKALLNIKVKVLAEVADAFNRKKGLGG